MRASLFLLTALLEVSRVKSGGQFIDLSDIDFVKQNGDLAYDIFNPIPHCVPDEESVECKDFSTLVKGVEDEVTIPCEECYTMEKYQAGESVEVGLVNVIGKLVFPPSTSMTLITKGIVVQGTLTMEQNQPIDGDPDVIIALKGNEDVAWVPENENAESCVDYYTGTETCNLGTKGFIVAGGNVDIRGFPKDTCPSWTKLADVVKTPPPYIENYPKPLNPNEGCTRDIITADFSESRGDWGGSTGTLVHPETDEDGLKYVRVSERTKNWQGFMLDTTGMDFYDCLLPDTPYLFHMKIKLTSANTSPSACSMYGTNCVSFKTHYMNEKMAMNWKTLYRVNLGGSVSDGEWATYAGEIVFSQEDISELNSYSTFYFSGPEAGIEISIASMSIKLPNSHYFPTPPTSKQDLSMCESLVVNGDAEVSSVFPYPFFKRGGMDSYLSVESETVDDRVNHYFSMKGRNKEWNSIETDLLTDCIELYSIYRFKARVRIFSDDEIRIRFTIVTTKADGTKKTESVGYCDNAHAAAGWVTCERNFMFKEDHVGAESIRLLFVTERDEKSVIHYDDIEVSLIYSPVTSLVVNSVEIEDCWGVGSEMMVTSHTIVAEDTKVVKITGVTANKEEGTTTIAFDTPIPAHTTLKDSPLYAVEVALLSRNIMIKPDTDTDIMNPEEGGHFMILHTPDQAQYIEGVEFRGMGQQGVLGRYPLHFHMSESVLGSVVSKNTVREGHQRCYVLHGTHNVTLTENVAYNTTGHCYMVEDGFEQDNTFERNIGALTKAVPLHNLLSISESDHLPSTFWISNPNNHFIENVCAGGVDTGFWYEFLSIVRGPSVDYDPDYSINPSEYIFGSHVGNTMHSYKGDGFKLYPNGYFPDVHAPFTDIKSYRNGGDGVLLHNSAKLHIKGGHFADNRVQVEVDKEADDVWVTDAVVVGYSEHFRKLVEASNTKSHCPAHRPNVGIQLHSFLRFRDSRGYYLKNITFEQFGEELTGCTGSVGIDLDPESRDSHFDAYSHFEDLIFPPGTPSAHKISLCANEEKSGLKDVVFEDWSGDLDPDEKRHAPGAVISRNGTLDTFIEGCLEMEGSCAKYCPKGCYRGVNFATAQSTEFADWSIKATHRGNNRTELFKGYFDTKTRLDFDDCDFDAKGNKINCNLIDDHYNNYIFQRRRYFTATLPAGEYDLEFVDGEGNSGWPTFIELSWEDNATCPEAINNDKISLYVPPTDGLCDQLIKNGDGEEGHDNHWMHAGGDVQVVKGGHNSEYAISSVKRVAAWQGPGQYLDSRCMIKGDYYEITARVKLQHNETGASVYCDPHQNHYMHPEVCPRLSFRMRQIMGHDIGDEVKTTFIHPVAETVGPYDKDGWNLMYGVVKISEHIAAQTTVFLFVERAAPGLDIILDDVRMGKVAFTESDSSYNRGFESGDTRYWQTFGKVDIDIVSPGHGGSNYAIKASGRDTWWASVEQELNQETLIKGHSYTVQAKIKLEVNGQAHDCTPGLWWGIKGKELEVCPTLALRIAQHNTTLSDFQDVSVVAGTWEGNGAWNEMYGEFVATEELLDAPALTIIWQKFDPSVDIIIDDISITEKEPRTCDDLIINPGGELEGGTPYYWKTYGTGAVDVAKEGHSSNHSLYNFGREISWDGIRQTLVPECIEPKALYEVSAWVKTVDQSGNGVGCVLTQTYGDFTGNTFDTKRCPTINIGAQNPGGAPQVRSVGSAVAGWDPDGWNLVKGYFQFFTNEMVADSIFVSISRSPPSYNVMVDDVSVRIFRELAPKK